jgi:cell division protein FtsI (penicillin-binding protein 3)
MTDMFEPGSTMKPMTVVAALESGKYKPDTLIDTNPGYIKVGRKAILDPVNYRVIDMTKMITKSSQVATSKVALSLDEQKVWEVFHRFGLGVSTGSGFPGESAGLLPNRPNWLPIERVNFAFGHGLTVTTLQLAQAYSVFANSGMLRPAVLLRNDDNAQQLPATRVISETVNQQVVNMLKTVTLPGGTATAARTASYTVAGKTGTSHKVGAGGYLDDRYTAVFAGLAPASDPRLVVEVMIDEPDLDNYPGGDAAAPGFGRVIAEALRILDVVPDKIDPKQVISRARNASGKLSAGGRKSV